MAFDVVLRDPGGGFDVTLTSTSAQNTDAAISAAVALSADLAATKDISGELAVSVAVSELLLDINEIASTVADVQVATSSDLLRTTSIDAALAVVANATAALSRNLEINGVLEAQVSTASDLLRTPSVDAALSSVSSTTADLDRTAEIQGSIQVQASITATISIQAGNVRVYTHAVETLSRDESSPDVQVYTHAAETLSRDTLSPKVQAYTHAAEVLQSQVVNDISAALVVSADIISTLTGGLTNTDAALSVTANPTAELETHARVSDIYADVLYKDVDTGRVSDVYADVLYKDVDAARMSDIYADVLYKDVDAARVSDIYVDVLYTDVVLYNISAVLAVSTAFVSTSEVIPFFGETSISTETAASLTVEYNITPVGSASDYTEDDPYNTDDSYIGDVPSSSDSIAVTIVADLASDEKDISAALEITSNASALPERSTFTAGSLELLAASSAALLAELNTSSELTVEHSSAALLTRTADTSAFTLSESVSADAVLGTTFSLSAADAEITSIVSGALSRTVDIGGSLTVQASSAEELRFDAIAGERIVSVSASAGTQAAFNIAPEITSDVPYDELDPYDSSDVYDGDSTWISGHVSVRPRATLGVSQEISAALTLSTATSSDVRAPLEISGEVAVTTTANASLGYAFSTSGTLPITNSREAGDLFAGVTASLAVTAATETDAIWLNSVYNIDAELAVSASSSATIRRTYDIYTIAVGKAIESDYSYAVSWTPQFPPTNWENARAFIPSRRPRPPRPFEVAMTEHAREGFLGGVGGSLASPSPVPAPVFKRRKQKAVDSPAMLFYQDSFPVGGTAYELTYIPIDYSEHAYLKKPSGEHVYQKQGDTWDRVTGTKNVIVYSGMSAAAGDILVFEYAYYANQPVSCPPTTIAWGDASPITVRAYDASYRSNMGFGGSNGALISDTRVLHVSDYVEASGGVISWRESRLHVLDINTSTLDVTQASDNIITFSTTAGVRPGLNKTVAPASDGGMWLLTDIWGAYQTKLAVYKFTDSSSGLMTELFQITLPNSASLVSPDGIKIIQVGSNLVVFVVDETYVQVLVVDSTNGTVLGSEVFDSYGYCNVRSVHEDNGVVYGVLFSEFESWYGPFRVDISANQPTMTKYDDGAPVSQRLVTSITRPVAGKIHLAYTYDNSSSYGSTNSIISLWEIDTASMASPLVELDVSAEDTDLMTLTAPEYDREDDMFQWPADPLPGGFVMLTAIDYTTPAPSGMELWAYGMKSQDFGMARRQLSAPDVSATLAIGCWTTPSGAGIALWTRIQNTGFPTFTQKQTLEAAGYRVEFCT